jgi:hypothetical protein
VQKVLRELKVLKALKQKAKRRSNSFLNHFERPFHQERPFVFHKAIVSQP